MNIIEKYERALEIAKGNDKLSCLVNEIRWTLESLQKGKCPTVLDEVWIDYFLYREDKEENLRYCVVYDYEEDSYFIADREDHSDYLFFTNWKNKSNIRFYDIKKWFNNLQDAIDYKIKFC